MTKANVIANANALLGVVENEFNVTTAWFNTPPGKFGTGHRQKVNLNLNATATSFPGANYSGYGSDINLDAQNATNTMPSRLAGWKTCSWLSGQRSSCRSPTATGTPATAAARPCRSSAAFSGSRPVTTTTTPRGCDLSTYLTAGGNKITGSDCSTKVELVAGADPCFANIDTTPGDPNRNNVFYLSQDLRVFTATPGLNNTPVTGGPTLAADSLAGAYTYLQQLLTFLNSNYNDPSASDPFNSALPAQAAALQGDSSVTPFTIDITNLFNVNVYNNYNFAIARVRLFGSSGSAGEAKNVRVFFRLWASQTADTDYQSSTTYLSTQDSAGLPGFPQPGVGHTTIPFFASGNNGANVDYGAADPT